MGIFGGGQKGDLSGYNCSQVNALRDVINNVAEKAGQSIVDRLHADIVVPMSSVWYAPEAITFFNGLAETVLKSGPNVTATFDAFRTAVQAAGNAWAENTGGERAVLSPISEIQLVLNVSDMKDNNAGNVTIDETQATAIANSLGSVEQEMRKDLETLAGVLNAESAFIGHGQSDALRNCFVTLSGEIHKIFKYLTEGETGLQTQINKAVQKYQQVSSDVSSAFNNQA